VIFNLSLLSHCVFYYIKQKLLFILYLYNFSYILLEPFSLVLYNLNETRLIKMYFLFALPVLRNCYTLLPVILISKWPNIQIRGRTDIIAANELTSKLVDWQAAGNRCTRKPKPDDSCLIGQCETLRCMAATIDCIILSNEMHYGWMDSMLSFWQSACHATAGVLGKILAIDEVIWCW